jgi:hypothetical protein
MSVIKKDTGLFESDCGEYQIMGACSGMRGMRTRNYELISVKNDKIICSGSLAACKKRIEYIKKISSKNADELNGWIPVSDAEHNDIMEKERGMGSIL